MDATRARRTRDRARQAWYARHRQWRFARYLGVLTGDVRVRCPHTSAESAAVAGGECYSLFKNPNGTCVIEICIG